jgi:DNA polymerase
LDKLPTGAPYQRILAFDFETSWSSVGFTLSKLTTEEYIRDPRFKAWGCSYQYVDDYEGRPRWVTGADLPAFFASIDWSTTAALAHNARFDVSILAWIYGHVPCFIIDTLSMARALHGVEVGNSLAKLAERYGLPPKGRGLHSTDGIMDVLPPHVEEELSGYCCHDTALCIAIYDRLVAGYPTKELRLIDMTLRMFVEPVLELDKQLLIDAIYEEKTSREALLTRLGVVETELASNDKFAELLKAMGVDIPMKISRTTSKPAYAFAKNDAMFQALMNHEREEVALLCEARLAVKSTLERTRAQRLLDVARRGALPVPLNYYAAHTGRWGGSDGINMQNLKRKGFLRNAISAPEGYVLVVADLSQIEPRVLAWLADYKMLLQDFAAGGDPYATFGSQMFGVKITKETHPDLRQSAKSALLGCGYGLGWASFAGQLLTGFLGAPPVLYGITFATQLGLRAMHVEHFMQDKDNAARLQEIPRTCTNDELAVHCAATQAIVNRYRKAAAPVVRFWRLCDDYINKCLVQDHTVRRFAGTKTTKHKCLAFTEGQVLLPNGLALRYPDMQGKPDEKGWVQWTYGENRKKLYGGKLTENITQAVARIVMTDGMLRIQKQYACKMTSHDEGTFLVPEEEVDEAVKWIREQMIREPKYLPGIPLDVTIGAGKRYGEAK